MNKNYFKIVLLILAAIMLSPRVNAQNADQKWGVGLYLNFNDYKIHFKIINHNCYECTITINNGKNIKKLLNLSS